MNARTIARHKAAPGTLTRFGYGRKTLAETLAVKKRLEKANGASYRVISPDGLFYLIPEDKCLQWASVR